ncbi:Hypothetical protein LOCK908_0337 [Lacticaseibacillus rhamnosus LOCK908]|nr:hypothetical protein LRHK_341 [Lacticaseibacillus rhamnosus ATCC 8530]AGP73021.1 Hypothetical protein LOCK908_0337 [Lacticaseibacillus rhamnosus LOCK908]
MSQSSHVRRVSIKWLRGFITMNCKALDQRMLKEFWKYE